MNPKHETPWWLETPWRLIQTNLSDIDFRDLDPDRMVADFLAFHATVAMINAGGISAHYPTALPFHSPNPHALHGGLSQLVDRCHENGIRVIARCDFSKVTEAIYLQNPDWAFRDAQGMTMMYNGYVQTCICGGYQQSYMFEILGEIFDRFPFDGLYCNMGGFQTRDYSFRDYGSCHCANCRDAYRAYAAHDGPQADPPTSGPACMAKDQDVAQAYTPTHYPACMAKDRYMAQADIPTGDPAYANFKKDVIRRQREKISAFLDGVSRRTGRALCFDGRDYVRIEASTELHRDLPYWPYRASSNCRAVLGGAPKSTQTTPSATASPVGLDNPPSGPGATRTHVGQDNTPSGAAPTCTHVGQDNTPSGAAPTCTHVGPDHPPSGPAPTCTHVGPDHPLSGPAPARTLICSDASVDFLGFALRNVSVGPRLHALRLWQNIANLGGLDYYLMGRIDRHEDRRAFEPIKGIYAFHSKHEGLYRGLENRADVLVRRGDVWAPTAEEKGWISALTQLHIPFAEILPDRYEQADLSRYRLVILPDSASMSEAEAAHTADFVRDGGVLLSTGAPGLSFSSPDVHAPGAQAPSPETCLAAYDHRPTTGADTDTTQTDPGAIPPLHRLMGIRPMVSRRDDLASAVFALSDEDRAAFPSFDDCDVIALGDSYLFLETEPGVRTYLHLLPPRPFGPPECCYPHHVFGQPNQDFPASGRVTPALTSCPGVLVKTHTRRQTKASPSSPGHASQTGVNPTIPSGREDGTPTQTGVGPTIPSDPGEGTPTQTGVDPTIPSGREEGATPLTGVGPTVPGGPGEGAPPATGVAVTIPWYPGEFYHRTGAGNMFLFMKDILCGICGCKQLSSTLSPMVEVTVSAAPTYSNHASCPSQPPQTVEATASAASSCSSAAPAGHTLVQLVNTAGCFGGSFWDPPPVHDVQLSIPFPRPPSGIESLMGRPVTWGYAHGRLDLTLDTLEEYDAIVISKEEP